MSWSKLDLIKKAFAQIGLAGYVFDLKSERAQDALSTMDAMMASWNDEGIRLGYSMGSTIDGSVDIDSGLPDRAYLAVYTNLAIELASGIGRPVTPKLERTAKKSYAVLLSKVAEAPRVRLPGSMPRGAGHKGWRGQDRVFLGQQEEDDIEAGPDGDLEFK